MVIRIPNWLGDALMATPVYYNLRGFLKEKEKVLLLGPPHIIPLFKEFPDTEVLPFYKGDFRKTVELLKPYKEEVGLLLTNSFSSAWLFFRAGLKERWGYAKDLRRFLLTRAVKPPKQKLHQRDYYLNLLKELGLPCEFSDLILPLSREIIELAEAFLKGIERPFIVLAPGAAYGPAKMWPKEYYRELAKNLVRQGYRIIICGSEKEKEVGDYIKEGVSGVYNFCGKTDLLQVAGIFSLAKAVVSNDSGLMHLAAALKVPQVAIFGSTDPELTGPLNPKAVVLKKELPCSPCFKRTCKYGHYNCLKTIYPEEVLENLLKSLCSALQILD